MQSSSPQYLLSPYSDIITWWLELNYTWYFKDSSCSTSQTAWLSAYSRYFYVLSWVWWINMNMWIWSMIVDMIVLMTFTSSGFRCTNTSIFQSLLVVVFLSFSNFWGVKNFHIKLSKRTWGPNVKLYISNLKRNTITKVHEADYK